MGIITISRQTGSLGDEIAHLLQKELDYYLLDKPSVEENVKSYGLSGFEVEKYDEKYPGFWDQFSAEKDKYLHFIEFSIYATAKQQNCIILGRGGQCILKDLPGVVHVRVIASEETRKNRIMESLKCSEKQARHILQHSDHERSGFHKFFFTTNWEDNELYDIIINTDTISVFSAAGLIKELLNSANFQKAGSETDQKINDLFLQQRVLTKILYADKIPVQFLEVLSKNGNVVLRGSVVSNQNIEDCKRSALEVDGVKSVETEIYITPNYMYM